MEQLIEEKKLKNISDFLATKGKITQIINPNLRMSIMLSQVGVSSAIILGMVGVGIFGLASYGAYMKIFVEQDKYLYLTIATHIKVYIMFVLLAITLLVAAVHCKRQSLLDISFLDNTTIIVNNTIFNIKENDCYIDVWEAQHSLGRGTSGPIILEWRLAISKNGCRKRYNLYLPVEYKKIIYRGFAREEYFNNFNRRTDLEELERFIFNFKYENEIIEEKSKRRRDALIFYETYEKYNKYLK